MTPPLKLFPPESSILRRKCQETFYFPYWLPGEMMSMMLKSKGIGLAAPQVGRTERIFVTGWGEVFINPVIIDVSDDLVGMEESCLSLPGVSVYVKRPSTIWMEGRNFSGMQARVIQHELDHLDGKLITDYLQPSSNEAGPVGVR